MSKSAETDRKKITVLLAEDHHVVRNGISSLLEKQADIEVIGEATNGAEALKLIEGAIMPHIVLTDINMPGMDGIELIEKTKALLPDTRIAVLSMLDNEKFVIRAFKAGASAYLLKNVSTDELTFAIRHVAAGGEYVCAEIAMRCFDRMAKMPEISATTQMADLDLSERDLEVLHLIAEGYTNQEIADKLFTGKRTVEGYRQQLMNKTGSRNTAALIKFAITEGLIS